MKLSRREINFLIAATPLGVVAACNGEGSTEREKDSLRATPVAATSLGFSDAHVHLFNASDLPIYGFSRYVVARKLRGVKLPAARALARSLSILSRGFAISAAMELEIITEARAEFSPERSYEEELADIIERGIKNELAGDLERRGLEGDEVEDIPVEELDPEAYRELAILVASVQTESDEPDASLRARSDDELIEQLLPSLEIIIADNSSERFATKRREREEDEGPFGGFTIHDAWQTLRWMKTMMDPRRVHLDIYQRRIGSGEDVPRKLANLLVDYDRWLDDRPARNSHHLNQLRFWNEFSGQVKNEIDIQTFAGYDPLKAAEQSAHGQTKLIDEVLDLYGQTATSFTGFKLYPPMGFKPYGNAGLHESDNRPFSGSDGIGRLVEHRWNRFEQNDANDIGAALDAELKSFYERCRDKGIPILAHAGNSVVAAEKFKGRMSPEHWYDLIINKSAGLDLTNLRICLGHFTHTRKFLDAVASLPEDPDEYDGVNNSYQGDAWALRWTGPLLWHSQASGNERRASVFTDISYMEELVEDDGKAFSVDFFKALKRFCKIFDPECKQMLFGTDWIMLGREPNYEKYLERVRHGLDKAKWPDDWQNNFLGLNYERFIY